MSINRFPTAIKSTNDPAPINKFKNDTDTDNKVVEEENVMQSFQKLLEAHAAQRTVLAEDLATNRKDAHEKVSQLTKTLVQSMNEGVLDIFEGQKQCELQAKRLEKKVEEFRAKQVLWAQSLKKFDESLRSIGDFENWVEHMEKELLEISVKLKKDDDA